jgi:hypothetical protein
VAADDDAALVLRADDAGRVDQRLAEEHSRAWPRPTPPVTLAEK